MSHIVTSRNTHWRVLNQGDGPVLLWLHGWGVSGRIWIQQIKYFSQNYQMESIKFTGTG